MDETSGIAQLTDFQAARKAATRHTTRMLSR